MLAIIFILLAVWILLAQLDLATPLLLILLWGIVLIFIGSIANVWFNVPLDSVLKVGAVVVVIIILFNKLLGGLFSFIGSLFK